MKIYNAFDEDPECLSAYSGNATFPSFTAESGQCVQIEDGTYYVFDISGVAGWNDTDELVDRNKTNVDN